MPAPDDQRDLETVMAYLLSSGVGYTIALFGDFLQLLAYENGTFAVTEAIILTDRHGKELAVDAQSIFATATGAIAFFEERRQKKHWPELLTEVTFSTAEAAVAFFEQRRQARQLGWDFETGGASLQRRANIRERLAQRQTDPE